MKAWVVEDTAAAEPLVWRDVPDPVAAPGKVLVRVRAAAVNFGDTLMIRGRYQVRPPLPFVPGQEVAGIVLEGGTRLSRGQHIASEVTWGGFAEVAAVKEGLAIALPPSIPFESAAALPVAYTTAYIALFDRARLAAGETVLVHAAAGSLGLATIQIARALGARVLAAVGTAAKAAAAREAGAEAVVVVSERGWHEQVKALTSGAGVDVILDSVGGEITEASLRCLAWGGRLLVAGFASGTIPAIAANRLLLRKASAMGVYWSHEREPALVEQASSAVLDLYQAGKIQPRVNTRFALEQLPQALAFLQSRQSIGKIVLPVGRGPAPSIPDGNTGTDLHPGP